MTINKLEIPIFPLEGVIVLPGSILPLNVFENRYKNMVDDSLLNGSRIIGMIQPLVKDKEKSSSFENIVGCFGRIIKFEETEKETYLISLKGLSRFRVVKSHLIKRGYINSLINTNDFENDLNDNLNENNFKFAFDKRLKMNLKRYLKIKKLDSNWDYINSCTNLDLINQLSMICPFSSHEKQMLLESNSIHDRYILLTSILENTVQPSDEKNEIGH